MTWQLNISAGELFDLIKPAVLVLSALISTWVFASARKRFSFLISLLWALAVLFLTAIVLPLYLIVLLARRKPPAHAPARHRLLAPLVYGAIVIGSIGIYLYRESVGVDVHLARAEHAKLRGQRARTIAEYQKALTLGDDPHTRKLLGVELFEAGYWTESLTELRRAEQGGETDELMSLRIASLLMTLNQPNQAKLEYKRFLASPLCTQTLPNQRCELAKRNLAQASSDTP